MQNSALYKPPANIINNNNNNTSRIEHTEQRVHIIQTHTHTHTHIVYFRIYSIYC